MWAHIMKERFWAKKPASLMLRFHTQTGGSTLTAQQPENNVVRVALQALAAVLGGTQSLHTNSLDEALWLPTERSVRVALRTQQIIAHESGVADSVDPLEAIDKGYIQSEIQEAAYRFQRAVEKKEEIVVGVNAFQVDDHPQMERLKVDPAIEEAQRAKLAALRSRRDAAKISALLARLVSTAIGSENLMPVFVECVENDVTLGEICNALRDLWGEYHPPVTL
jgi:methylmalonyl-CoA mutase N-terminal domain/subunit